MNNEINQDIVNLEDVATENDIVIEEEKTPFFSIIVPCYNSKVENIKALLQSIIDGGCTNEIELIISDGGSTDVTYQDEVRSFIQRTDIPFTMVTLPEKTPDGVALLHCPGNTREYGAWYAKGEQITFIDHDDVFNKDVFTIVKKAIEETHEEYLVCSNILQVNPLENDNVIHEIKQATNWMHGKFYNRKNLQKKYNFHFKQNLVSNEDIYISNRLHCVLYNIGKEDVLFLPDFLYIQKTWPDSTSHKKYSDELTYMEYYFYDYIDATYGVHDEEYNRLIESSAEISEDCKKFYTELQVDALLYQFHYLQVFKYLNPKWLKEHEDKVKNNIKKFYKKYNVDADYLYSAAKRMLFNNEINEEENQYNIVRRSTIISCGNYIETDGFYNFITQL